MVLILIGLAIILLLLLLIFSLLFSQVKISIQFTYRNHSKNLTIQMILWKYIKFTRNIPIIDLNTETFSLDVIEKDHYFGKKKEKNKSFTFDDIKQQWTLVNEVLKTTKDVIPHVKKAMKAVHIHQFSWHTMVGVTRADQTAILTGLMYTTKGGLASFVMNYLTFKCTPVYSIQPYYVKPTYQTDLECILSFKLGQIMRELFSVAKQYGKLKKVGTK
ncbi:hypothetical protein ACTWQB_01675 [Piscibacillus sp. B03]|uniref:hypothetical protein n=1 Tax=Piscibacillus sp. B03 TaxID=3457430 RepID=UPI003FCD319E